MEAIEVSKLQVAYEHKLIIANMNLKIPMGKITMIIGANGCGKIYAIKNHCTYYFT